MLDVVKRYPCYFATFIRGWAKTKKRVNKIMSKREIKYSKKTPEGWFIDCRECARGPCGKKNCLAGGDENSRKNGLGGCLCGEFISRNDDWDWEEEFYD